MQDFRNLRVATSARWLTRSVYDVTDSFPWAERFGLTAQMRRAAVSVGANIAEGCGRFTDAELASFLQNGMGSLSELEFEMLLSMDLGFLAEPNHHRLEQPLVGTKRELVSLIASVRGLDLRTLLRRMDQTTKPAYRKRR